MTPEIDKSLDDILHRVSRLAAPNSATGTATINVNAGGLGVVVSTICAAVSTTVAIFLGVALFSVNSDLKELRQKDDAFQAYINMGLVKPAEEPK